MSEWSNVKLKDIAEIRFSNVDKIIEHGEYPVRLCNYMDVYGNSGYITADLPFMEASASRAEIERFRIQKGDVIITKDSETPDDIGIPAVVVEGIPNLICGYHLALIKPDREQIDSIYLAKQLGSKSTASYFSKLANGSTRYGLSSYSIASTTIPLAPITAQRRIAEILSTVDEAIEKTEVLIEKYKQIKAGMMHDLFTRGVTPNGKLRPTYAEAPQLYKDSPLGWIPKAWEVKRLDESEISIIDGDRGENYPQGNELTDSGYCLFLNANNVTPRGFKYDQMQFISKEKDQLLGTGKLIHGDVVITTRGTVGNIAFFDEKVPFSEVRINSGMIILRNNQNDISSEFLNCSLKYFVFAKEFKRVVSGSAQPQLPIKDLKRFHLLILPIPEQLFILSKGIAIESYLISEEDRLFKLYQLKQGLMNDLLTGKVRVKVEEEQLKPVK